MEQEGVTAENQEQADKRIPELAKIPAIVRFISYEPALGPVDLTNHLYDNCCSGIMPYHDIEGNFLGDGPCQCNGGPVPTKNINWLICGCESGHHRRPMNIEWAESVRDQCKAAGVAFFMKQMEINGKVETDIEKFPASLKVREFPESAPCAT